MFKRLFIFIMILSIFGITAAPLDAGISKTTTFTLSVTIPQRSELPSEASSSPSTSDRSDPNFKQSNLQRDIRDNQDVYLVSFVVD